MSRKAWIWVLWAAATTRRLLMLAAWMLVAGDRRPFPDRRDDRRPPPVRDRLRDLPYRPGLRRRREGREGAEQGLPHLPRPEELRAADDSHSTKRFRSPRMAAFREKLDARLCTSCHVEHRPEITRASAVSVAMDFCVACHSEGEQDVRKNRPSHAGLGFDTCASSGCHNYHDNRALYEDFLVKHAHADMACAVPAHALAARQRSRAPAPEAALGRDDAAAPAAALGSAATVDDWAGSGHAAAGVNCAACPCAGSAPGTPRFPGSSPIGRTTPAPAGLRRLSPAAGEDLRARPARYAPASPDQQSPVTRRKNSRRSASATGCRRGLLAALEDPSPPATDGRPRGAASHAGRSRAPTSRLRKLSPAPCGRHPPSPRSRRARPATMTAIPGAYVEALTHQLWLAEIAGEAKPGTGG